MDDHCRNAPPGVHSIVLLMMIVHAGTAVAFNAGTVCIKPLSLTPSINAESKPEVALFCKRDGAFTDMYAVPTNMVSLTLSEVTKCFNMSETGRVYEQVYFSQINPASTEESDYIIPDDAQTAIKNCQSPFVDGNRTSCMERKIFEYTSSSVVEWEWEVSIECEAGYTGTSCRLNQCVNGEVATETGLCTRCTNGNIDASNGRCDQCNTDFANFPLCDVPVLCGNGEVNSTTGECTKCEDDQWMMPFCIDYGIPEVAVIDNSANTHTAGDTTAGDTTAGGSSSIIDAIDGTPFPTTAGIGAGQVASTASAPAVNASFAAPPIPAPPIVMIGAAATTMTSSSSSETMGRASMPTATSDVLIGDFEAAAENESVLITIIGAAVGAIVVLIGVAVTGWWLCRRGVRLKVPHEVEMFHAAPTTASAVKSPRTSGGEDVYDYDDVNPTLDQAPVRLSPAVVAVAAVAQGGTDATVMPCKELLYDGMRDSPYDVVDAPSIAPAGSHRGGGGGGDECVYEELDRRVPKATPQDADATETGEGGPVASGSYNEASSYYRNVGGATATYEYAGDDAHDGIEAVSYTQISIGGSPDLDQDAVIDKAGIVDGEDYHVLVRDNQDRQFDSTDCEGLSLPSDPDKHVYTRPAYDDDDSEEDDGDSSSTFNPPEHVYTRPDNDESEGEIDIDIDIEDPVYTDLEPVYADEPL